MTRHLVRVCHVGAPDSMLDQIDNLFTTSAASSDVHLATYWNLRLQTYVWLNGPNGPRNDFLVHPYSGGDADSIEIGFTIQHASILRRLYYLRRNVHVW